MSNESEMSFWRLCVWLKDQTDQNVTFDPNVSTTQCVRQYHTFFLWEVTKIKAHQRPISNRKQKICSNVKNSNWILFLASCPQTSNVPAPYLSFLLPASFTRKHFQGRTQSFSIQKSSAYNMTFWKLDEWHEKPSDGAVFKIKTPAGLQRTIHYRH